VDQSNDWVAFLKAAQEIEKEYHRELDNNKKLTVKLQAITKEYEALNRSYLEAKRNLTDLRAETERLKSVYPVYDLLKAKEAEVVRMKKALARIEEGHPEWAAIEAMVKAHVIELNELRDILQDVEERFKVQLERIQASVFSSNETDSFETDSFKESQPSPSGNEPKKFVRVPEH